MSDSLEKVYIDRLLNDEEKQLLEWINEELDFDEILSRIKMGDIKTSDETELYMNVVTKIKKSLEKRKLNVFDWSVGFEDREGNKPSHFLIEFMFNGKIVLLDGKVIDRYISEVS